MAFQVKKFDSIIASMVNWISSNTSKITDFNVGSVVRTILESIAMELEELYYQLMKAVEEAIEEAIYRAFNFPRNPAQRSTGLVRFFRLRGTDVPVNVPRLTTVATDSVPPILYETQTDSVVTAISSSSTGGSALQLIDTTRNFVNEGVVLGSKVKNITDSGETLPAGVLSISDTINTNDTLNFSSLTNGASFALNITAFTKVYYSNNGVVSRIVIGGTATGGSTTTLVDTTKNFTALGVVVGSIVTRVADGKWTIVTSISGAGNTTLNFTAGAGTPTFAASDIYTVGVGLYFPVGLVVNQDYIYAGSTGKFFGFQFNLGATANIQNLVANSVVEYWNGSAWVSVQGLVDTTAGSGKPFSNNGLITWNLPLDWAQWTYHTTFGDDYLYWIRISTNANLTPTAEGYYFRLRRGDEYKIISTYRDISVQAVDVGVSGNVKANSIIVLRSSLSNIESISNIAAFSDGTEEETDLERKARFALYIQSLARATRGALEYAARTVEQIIAAKAVDDVRATVLREKYGTPSVWTNITSQMRNPGDAEVPLFEASQLQYDALYIGASELFEYINMHLVTNGVCGATPPVWQYYSTTGWKTFYPIDGTDPASPFISGALQEDGSISFTPPSDWVALAVPAAGVTSFSYTRLWIRLIMLGASANYSPVPTGDFCSLPPGFGYVFLYCHDGSGTLNASLKASVESAVEPYRGCGIVVEVKAPNLIYPTIIVSLLVAANYDADDLVVKVKQALIDYLNAKVLGEDLYIAELYQFIMDYDDKAILNVTISVPSQDILVPSSEVIRPDPLLITVSGTTV